MKKYVIILIFIFQYIGIKSQELDKLSYSEILTLLDKDGSKLSSLPSALKYDKKTGINCSD